MNSPLHKENVIREKRTMEATKKNLMGPGGKLGLIARTFGKPIIRQGNPLYDATYMNLEMDFTEEHYEKTLSGQNGPLAYREEIAEMGEEGMNTEGFLFDALSSGIHLEIQLWIENNRLRVYYKGHVVYEESGAELEAYTPFDEWEQHVNRLYDRAKVKAKVQEKTRDAVEEAVVEKQKASIFQILREKWGI